MRFRISGGSSKNFDVCSAHGVVVVVVAISPGLSSSAVRSILESMTECDRYERSRDVK